MMPCISLSGCLAECPAVAVLCCYLRMPFDVQQEQNSPLDVPLDLSVTLELQPVLSASFAQLQDQASAPSPRMSRWFEQDVSLQQLKRTEIEQKVADARAKILRERLAAERARKQAEIRNPLLRVPPPQPFFTDHVTGRQRQWPRRADGLPFSAAQVAVGIRSTHDFIWHARAFGTRRLQQLLRQPRLQQLPLRLKRVLYGEPRGCVQVSAAGRVRMSCGFVVPVAVGLGTVAGTRQTEKQLRNWASCIAQYVYGCYSRKVEVGCGDV